MSVEEGRMGLGDGEVALNQRALGLWMAYGGGTRLR